MVLRAGARTGSILLLLLIGSLIGGPVRAESPAQRPDGQDAVYAQAELAASETPSPDGPAPSAPVAPVAVEPPVATTGNEAPATKTLTPERLQELITATQQVQGLSDEVKAEVQKRYQAALEWLVSADETAQRTAQYESETQQAPQLVEKAKQELATNQSVGPADPPADATLPQLEQLLAEAQTQLNEAQQRLAQREDEVKRRGDRQGELAKLSEETKQRFEETQKQSGNLPPSGEAAELTAARRIELEARSLALKNQLALSKAESQRLDLLSELFPLNRDLAKREKNVCEKQVTTLQEIVSQRREIESERQAQEARRQVQMAHPALRNLAERNAALAEMRQSVSEHITQVSAEVSQIDKSLESLQSDFQRAQDKVAKAGHSTTVGFMLRRQREQLPQVHACEGRIRFVAREMPVANLDRLELEEERGALGDMDAAVAAVLRSLGSHVDRSDTEYLEQTVRDLLIAKRDLMDRLVNDLDAYLVDLSELEVGNRRLITEIDRFADFIDEHVLWIRSADALRVHDIAAAVRSLSGVARPGPWMDLAKYSGVDALSRPLMATAVLFCAALLVAFHTRLRRRISELCESRSCCNGVRFGPTLEALLLAGIAAAQWPLLACYLGWRMTMADQTSDLGLAVGPSLEYVAVLFWLSEFVRLMCRNQGVAETYFGWPAYALAIVRREMWWLTLLGIPLAGLTVFAQLYDQGAWTNALGRLAFLGAMLVLTNSAHFLLRSQENILREAITRDPKGWLSRVRVVAYALSVSVPMLLAVLAAIGYYYSAQQLALRLQTTLAVLLAIVLLHAMSARWCLVRRRALALQQARDRQQRATDSGDGSDKTVAMPAASPAADARADLSAIHEKLQVLLQHAVTVGILLSTWLIWADVLPALRVLDRVVFWVKTVDVVEMYRDIDGTVVRQQVPQSVPTTLRHGVIAATILLVTFTLGKNLPALLEITLLSQLPFDKGGRHAISVILRYLVALTGVLLACSTLSIDWSSIQWLAAGITVGLGFGLQEIFANFVSGLILLFERPIRVGDVITLGDVTGTVTNMRIRATTVMSPDMKELIVPNKELVTGRLLNWTLSDTTNRILIEVGLGYRTDTERARAILLATVRSHPYVLKDPEPDVTFEGFGESSLRFVVRAYVATMDVRMQTTHELHTRIFQRLQEAQIDLPLPQRDLHVHLEPSGAWPAGLPGQPPDRRSAAA